MKSKKTTLAFLGFLFSALLAGVFVGVNLIWEYAPPHISIEIEGDQAFDRGDYVAALQYWIRAKDRSEHPGRLYKKMGTAYLKLSNLDRADICFKKALKNIPEDIEIQKQIIQISLIKGDKAAAEELLSQLVSEHGSDPDFLIVSGDLAMLQTKFNVAEAAYEKATALLPDSVRPKLKLAICLQEQKKTFEAERLITLCRSQGINDPMNLMLVADYYVLAGNNTRAEQYLLMAVNAEPGNLEFKTRLCLFYRVAGMVKKATSHLKKLMVEYPENIGLKMMLTDFYLTLEDMTKAEDLLKQLGQTNKDEPRYNLLMGKFWLYKGRYSHAVSYLKTALDKDFSLVSAQYLLGVAYFAGGQGKLAEKTFIQALMLNPGHGESTFAMAALNYKRGNYSLADQYANRLINQDVSNAQAWKIKGLCALGSRDASGAINLLSKSWFLEGDTSTLFFLGLAFEGQGMVQQALKAYKQVLEDVPAMYPALYAYARLSPNQNQILRILDKIDALVDQNEIPGVYYAEAKICFDLKDYTRCQEYIDKALAGKNNSGRFFLLQAALFEAIGQENNIEKTLIDCTTKLPQFVGGWLKLSEYFVKRQRISDALHVLEKSLTYFPDNPKITGNIAWLLLEENKDFDRAFDLSRTAYDRLPGEAWLMDTLGWAYYHKKIYSQAEWMLAQAEEVAPKNGTIQYHQGVLLYHRGKLFQAKTKLESAIGSVSLDAKHRDEAENLLAKLNGKKDSKKIGNNIIFLPEDATALDLESQIPSLTDEGEDALKPDWSNMDSF